jgi:beta-glucosidase
LTDTFPEGFLWGASTASYQIEGAAREDGRGPSIWDIFSHIPGKVANGDTGDVACDHYHRWREDVGLMRELGIGAYRFSVAWPRILPTGRGATNEAGLAFYDRLVDALLEAKIEPWLCLYHWDLPQALEDKGGWRNRDVAYWYADYAAIVARRLADRITHWATFNEPNNVAYRGYGVGDHAPGLKNRDAVWQAIHTVNLAHGLGMTALRDQRADLKLGTIYSLAPRAPASDREPDVVACQLLDALMNRAFPDPQILGRYPEPIADRLAPLIRADDFAIIRRKPDYFAFNHYTHTRVRHDKDQLFHCAPVPFDAGAPVTDMGWEVAPDALRETLLDAKARYAGELPIYILENGAAFSDHIDAAGRVQDPKRVAYLRRYLGAVLDAIAAGVPVKGYFVWSLLDNFEWALGYEKRFGIVYVDFATQARIPKASFYFYRDLAQGAPLDRD